MLASLDVTRPAAREQLRLLGGEADVAVLPEKDGDACCHHQTCPAGGQASVWLMFILDTAGRTTVNEALMNEVRSTALLNLPKSCSLPMR